MCVTATSAPSGLDGGCWFTMILLFAAGRRRVTWPALQHRCRSDGGRSRGEAPPVTRSAWDAEADLIRAGQALGCGPQRQPGEACPNCTGATALGQSGRRALRNRMAMAERAAHRRPADARAWATSQNGKTMGDALPTGRCPKPSGPLAALPKIGQLSITMARCLP